MATTFVHQSGGQYHLLLMIADGQFPKKNKLTCIYAMQIYKQFTIQKSPY
ncbi:hypothetical protein MKX01_033678 [Papaver californicum]|nr:hypothetical protein MKX01_033678 [Papaver californicum]